MHFTLYTCCLRLDDRLLSLLIIVLLFQSLLLPSSYTYYEGDSLHFVSRCHSSLTTPHLSLRSHLQRLFYQSIGQCSMHYSINVVLLNCFSVHCTILIITSHHQSTNVTLCFLIPATHSYTMSTLPLTIYLAYLYNSHLPQTMIDLKGWPKK